MSEEAWTVIEMMAEKGGWDEINFVKGKPKTTKGDSEPKRASKGRAVGRGRRKEDIDEDVGDADPESSATNKRKRKAVDTEQVEDRRRSTRARK